jgi:hypothetical protein
LQLDIARNLRDHSLRLLVNKEAMKTKRLSHLSFALSGLPVALLLILGTAANPMPAHAAGSSKTEGRDSPFVGQTQIAATILQSFRPVGVFQVDMGILVTNPAQRTRAASLQPILRDAWRRTTQEFANSYLTLGRVPDAVLLGQRLQAATDQVMGAGNARLLLTSVVVR